MEIAEPAIRTLKKLQKSDSRRILDFLEDRVSRHPEPRKLAKPLSGMPDIWRFRVGDYRIITRIEDSRLTVLVVAIGHRREVYRQT
ncbi:type II toxin-antitoxin system RelE/ParE family toxin [Stappia sp. F7233]|uniref:Type II toxin-antitoxin system RelE/ParE family toxin n=1 Tax=Stappia albiluteola TaxID=2758565 RepID=A0A839AF70_9HYPH|nr:type II toxin-antitoxin system RelE/ParE family toxin [Stappia albiluteola]